jgi:hypothetical protein
MHGVVRFDVISDEMDQLGHDCLNSRRIAGGVGCPQAHAVEPFVVWANAKTLARRELGPGRVHVLETVLRITASKIDNDRFDGRLDAF